VTIHFPSWNRGMSNLPSFRSGNRLLDSLPPEETDRLLALMRLVSLELRKVLIESRTAVPYVYFPTQSVVSQVVCTSTGDQIEVAAVGNDGLVGLCVLLGDPTAPTRYVIQVPGAAYRMSADVLQTETRRDSPLRRVLFRYLSASLRQLAQGVACSGLHPITQRCARWLLTTHDRVQGDTFPLTHEFLSTMLGVRRSSVSEILQPLARQGLIRNGRGAITILDRMGLEALSCECYRTVKEEFDTLLG
jgi:CRP-like cAMP-binding protein